MLTGKGVEAVCLKFDEVYYLKVAKQGPNIMRTLQTQPDGLRKVGSRYGLPNGTEWEWDAIHKQLLGV